MELKSILKVVNLLSPKPDLSKPRLITVGFSHFCEKARWALDHSPLQYYEEKHGPALHLAATLNLSAVPRVTTWNDDDDFKQSLIERHPVKIALRKEKTAIPKLFLPSSFLQKHNIKLPYSEINYGGGVVSDGAAGILKLLSDIYPHEMGHLHAKGKTGENIMNAERLFDCELASAVSNWSFGNMVLSGSDFYEGDATVSSQINEDTVDMFLAASTNGVDVPLIEKLIIRCIGKRFIVPLMAKANMVNAANRDKGLRDVERIFQYVDDVLLKKNNPTGSVHHSFLMGTNKPTAADIAFAAFSAPILLPAETDSYFMSISKLDNLDAKTMPGCFNTIKVAQELLRKYKSAQYVLDLYAEHRRVSS